MNMKPVKPIIKLTLSYNDMESQPFSESFLYLNDTNLSDKQLADLCKGVRDRDNLIAPKYGLPQLAPFDHPAITDIPGLPYSTLESIETLNKLNHSDSAKIIEITDFHLFSKVYPYLRDDEPCPLFVQMRKSFIIERVGMFLDECSLHFDELGLPPALLDEAKLKVSEKDDECKKSIALLAGDDDDNEDELIQQS